MGSRRLIAAVIRLVSPIPCAPGTWYSLSSADQPRHVYADTNHCHGVSCWAHQISQQRSTFEAVHVVSP